MLISSLFLIYSYFNIVFSDKILIVNNVECVAELGEQHQKVAPDGSAAAG